MFGMLKNIFEIQFFPLIRNQTPLADEGGGNYYSLKAWWGRGALHATPH